MYRRAAHLSVVEFIELIAVDIPQCLRRMAVVRPQAHGYLPNQRALPLTLGRYSFPTRLGRRLNRPERSPTSILTGLDAGPSKPISNSVTRAAEVIAGNISVCPQDGMIWNYCMQWRGGASGKAFGLAISRSRVQILLEATLRNYLRQVVYTYVPLSLSSITWYRPKGGDALWLGR